MRVWLGESIYWMFTGRNSDFWLISLISSFDVWLLSLSLILRPTVSRPVCLGIKHPSGAYDQICITVRQLRVYRCGALTHKRTGFCRLQLLLAFASAVILESETRWTRDHILLSEIRDFPFRCLLRLAGLWWRYSTPPQAQSGAHDQIFITVWQLRYCYCGSPSLTRW
jgi:hypothetical protein